MRAPLELALVDRVLVLLARHRRAADEDAWLRDVAARLTPGQLRDLAAKVELNDVAPQVLISEARAGVRLGVAPGIREAWTARATLVRNRNLRRVQEGAALFAEMGRRGIDVILLKGGLFAEELWGDPAYKKMNDLDVLIRPEDLTDVRELYEERGYLPLVLFEGGDPEDVDPAKTHHLPSYVSRDMEFVIGTHWELCSRKKKIRLDYERMWAESRPVPFYGTTVRSLTPEDNLHHLAIHFHHYKTGLKELADVFNYARHTQPDWDLLGARIAEAGTAGRAHYVFSLAQALQPMGTPTSFDRRLEREADAFRRSEVSRRLAKPELLLQSRSTYESTIEKAYTRYALETRFHRKLPAFLVFFWRLVFPPLWVLRRTNHVPRVTLLNLPWLWLVNLWRTGREIGEGLGMAVFLAVTIKGSVEVLISLQNYWDPPTDDPLTRLREAVGGDDAALERLMDYLE